MNNLTLQNYDDILIHIHEHGSMKFSEIRKHFGLSDLEIESFQTKLEKETPKIIKKGRKYIVKDSISFKEDLNQENALNITKNDWEQKGVERLCEIYSFKNLSNLLEENLRYAFVKLRQSMTSNKRTSCTKKEMSNLLILEYGRDLFENKIIRESVGKKCNIKKKDIPKKWVSGGLSAKEFVKKTNFPKEFSGIQRKIEEKPRVEFLMKQHLNKLANFQNEIKDNILNELNSKPANFLISLPTGSGKTKVAVDSILSHINHSKSNSHILWLAHTEELCEQAYMCFKETAIHVERNYDIYLFRYWGNYALDEIGNSEECPFILISTPQKIKNILSANNTNDEATNKKNSLIKKFLKKDLMMLVIDEAHRTGSNTYNYIINTLKQENNLLSIAGLTATPFRKEYDIKNPHSGTNELKEIFGNLLLPEKTLGDNLVDIKESLRKKEYLSHLKKIKIDTGIQIKLNREETTSISMNNIEGLSLLDKKIQARADSTKRRLNILKAIQEEVKRCPDGKFLYFGPTVRDVKLITMLLRANNFTADYVVGSRKISTRRKIIKDFKNGDIQFLCNCEVLTTGFDEPAITHIIMARPTVSQVLYEQMIGRGLRGPKFNGTKNCTILSCEDINLNYNEFYRIWREEKNYKSEKEYNFLDVLFQTLVFVLNLDKVHKDVEKTFLKNVLDTYGEGEVITYSYIDQKIKELTENNSYYFDELPRMLSFLTKDEKQILLKRSEEMCLCDREFHEKEKKFIELLKNQIQKSNQLEGDNTYYKKSS